MSLQIVGGKLAKPPGIEVYRVAYLAFAPPGMVQMINGKMALMQRQPIGMPPTFSGPIHRGWAEVCKAYPDITKDLTFLGAQVAILTGEFRGTIAWVNATDEPPQEAAPDADV